MPFSNKNDRHKLYKLLVSSIFSAISSFLMLFSFSVPFAPEFLKLDLSEIPALIVSFAIGPAYGILVELIKNIINIFFTTNTFIGNIANFLIGSSFVFTAGIIYKHKKNQKVAVISLICATITMAAWGTLINYFFLIPIYSLVMPIDSILAMFGSINNNFDSLFNVVLFTIFPFNILKGTIISTLTFLLYKKISPIINKVLKY